MAKTNNKTLYFEGVGWAEADTSKTTNVGNCRIRTRIRNTDGRLIYLELTGTKHEGKYIPEHAKGNNVTSYIQAVFYEDNSWDKNSNYSRALRPLENMHFEYNKENILYFVNEKLNCNFESVEVINEGLHVFSKENPISDCSKESYTPFKEIEININELSEIKPLYDCSKINFNDYVISHDDIVKLIPNIVKPHKEDNRKIYKHDGSVRLRYNEYGIIKSCEIDCEYGCISFGIESLEQIINSIKQFKKAA